MVNRRFTHIVSRCAKVEVWSFVQFGAELFRFNGGNDAIACVDDGGSCSSLYEHFSARVES